MNSTPKSQRRKILITLLLLSFLSVVIFIFKESKPVLFFEGIAQNVFSTPKGFMYSLGKKETNNKINLLTKKNQQLEQKLVEYELIKRDNEALKSQFTLYGSTSQNLVAAKIIGYQGGTQPLEFVINVGQKNGIKKSMSVISQKYLIGKVQFASQNYSVVTTPYNQNFKVLAKLPETNANGILVGRNDFMLFDGVIITDTLKKDGVVVTKGEVDSHGIGVVPDMIIGKITSISKNETSPFQSAQVIPMVDYSKILDVFVISQM
jgi:rod shape-determining protein MreC